ncbi:DUF3159 domain-containing protein [Cellulomonas sp. Leaf334]|uniref:DUF3159 domain-containing protein n=1 Tax=Cellulomonas sp. Leaf334 TaxID=1736339 RepID=UPI000700A355|nr:DUF3159 domain-containing protein [Cellulomonas sp. Leaf334]KQR16345.1 hypothetical protein ASF78_02820 [Cellulomonas sp. Leaf334]
MSEPERRDPEDVLAAVDDGTDPQDGPARGMKVLSSDTFSASDAVGGVRGIVESVAPGMLFVVVYVATGQQLMPALVVALAAAVVTVVARLVQRQSPTQAFGGFLGVGIGVLWAWRTGDAKDFFAYGLWVNVSWFLGTLLTIVIGWPLVGLVVGLFSKAGPLNEGGSWAGAVAWRQDRPLRRRYALATVPFVALFGLRLAVQLPLYFSSEVTWLGTAKLVMGVPGTALALWVSWLLVRGSTAPREQPRPLPEQ